ncbi:hypothetical protein F503_07050 [Ophiostoma piceae UAMH 11346]|uniref:DUF4097 domain-containing protein n=1 Tax=Ophiostoma piceae (strain UAMH 11346) TaxID=1262450 RepID=S3C6Y4_OPHP1|nr:hypothetical protein F503_07050 [Ophiostoma piceae UAMH 11346]
MDSISEKQPLLAAADPELQRAYKQVAARKAARRRRVARRVKLAALAVALFFFFSSTTSFGFVSALISSIIPAFKSPSRPLNPGPSDPSSPSSPEDPSSPSPSFPGDVGVSLSTPLEGPLVLPERSQCIAYNGGSGLKTYPLATYPLTFDGQHGFSFRQNTTRRDEYSGHWRRVRVSGEVVVRKATPNKAPSVDVEALSNDDRIRTAYAYVESAQSLDVTVDDRIWFEAAQDPAYSRGVPCLVVRATVWLPAVADDSDAHAAHLKDLLIANTHLGIQLLDDVNLVVDEFARLASVVGSIAASRALSAPQKPHWYSKAAPAVASAFGADYRFEAPETDVETTSSSISGPWTLLNRLHFGSVSGSVHVAVAPEGSTPSDRVADLSLRTTSGSIGFEEIARASSRAGTVHAHTLSVSSQSGTIRGTGSFARNARLHSTSGSIKVSLQPVALAENAADRGQADHEHKAVLETKTVSGSTEISLLAEAAGKTLDFLSSVHTAVSGSVKLHYPASWAGGIHLKSTLSGSLAVEGKGVHVLPGNSPRWPPHAQRRLEAVKDVPADGAAHTALSNVVAEAVSGSVRLSFPL